MSTTPIPPSLERFGDELNRAAHRELSNPPEPARVRAGRHRPRLLAGGTLGLAGVGTALVLALSAATTSPAFAVTRNDDGSVTVQINESSAITQANAKLTAMGIAEQVTIYMAAGPATVSGGVSCTTAPGANVSGPPLKVLVGANGTEVISQGQSAGNTGEGTWHLDRCVVSAPGTGAGTGNTGA